MALFALEHLSFSYPDATVPALDELSLEVERGEYLCVCGKSGCGKTTFLRQLKSVLAPFGQRSGAILLDGVSLDEVPLETQARRIGFVMQDPDAQIVTDKVWHELAFGLENMGIQTEVIRRRVGEMASYFGIAEWFRKKTDELSGGQKQLLNLASVMVMQPKILILDEPTSQLDPIAASDFISTLQKLNREFGLTILLAEHRLEDVFPIADKVLLMDSGKALIYDSPRNIGKKLSGIQKDHPMLLGLPSAVRIFDALNIADECPLTVKEGKDFLERHFSAAPKYELKSGYNEGEDAAVELKNVWFRYEKDLPDILRGTSLRIQSGEFYCILGGNGTGKTTALNVIAGLNKAYRGKVLIGGKSIRSYKGNSLYRENLALLPQNPQTVFIKDNVLDDLLEILEALEIPKSARAEKAEKAAAKIGITHLLNRHPYDLSGGEQQKCALAKILLSNPKILLLDEPTKGLDAYSKHVLKSILQELKNDGITILTVTHDVEFAAENSDRCALFFDGEILSPDIPEKFFAENNFYTTAANRMARLLFPNAVTCRQVTELCQKQI